jgi:hypothetical protein
MLDDGFALSEPAFGFSLRRAEQTAEVLGKFFNFLVGCRRYQRSLSHSPSGTDQQTINAKSIN